MEIELLHENIIKVFCKLFQSLNMGSLFTPPLLVLYDRLKTCHTETQITQQGEFDETECLPDLQ